MKRNGSEKKLIQEKIRLLPTDNINAYALKIVSDGYIVVTDHDEIKSHVAELQKITVNVGQILKHTDAMGAAYIVGAHEIRQKIDRYMVYGASIAFSSQKILICIDSLTYRGNVF